MNGDELKESAVPYVTREMQSPFDELADELYQERIEQARRMSPEEKFLAGEELFEYASSITLAGIHSENPGLSEDECRRILEERLAWRERQDWEEAE